MRTVSYYPSARRDFAPRMERLDSLERHKEQFIRVVSLSSKPARILALALGISGAVYGIHSLTDQNNSPQITPAEQVTKNIAKHYCTVNGVYGSGNELKALSSLALQQWGYGYNCSRSAHTAEKISVVSSDEVENSNMNQSQIADALRGLSNEHREGLRQFFSQYLK